MTLMRVVAAPVGALLPLIVPPRNAALTLGRNSTVTEQFAVRVALALNPARMIRQQRAFSIENLGLDLVCVIGLR